MTRKKPENWKTLARAKLDTMASNWSEDACVRGKKGSLVFSVLQDDPETGESETVEDDIPLNGPGDIETACDLLYGRSWPEADVEKVRKSLVEVLS